MTLTVALSSFINLIEKNLNKILNVVIISNDNEIKIKWGWVIVVENLTM